MDISKSDPNTIDPSKPTLPWRPSTVRAAPMSKLRDWGRASWSHHPTLRNGASRQCKPTPVRPVGLPGRCTVHCGVRYTPSPHCSPQAAPCRVGCYCTRSSVSPDCSELHLPVFSGPWAATVPPLPCPSLGHSHAPHLLIFCLPSAPSVLCFQCGLSRAPAGDTQTRDQVRSQPQSSGHV